MQRSYTNNLYQSPLSPPAPDQSADFDARYTNPAYSSRPPSSPSEFQMSLGGPLQAHMPATGQNRDEQEFAKALELFMDDNSIQNALEAFAQSCSQHSRDLRAEGQENQYRAARLMHLQAEASVLEAEAATWTLLLHMYARTNKTYPGGRGGQQTSVPTVHHTVASIISDDAKLLQCARVITWLEELASQTLDYTTEQGQGPRFHQKSGVWSDTQAALQDRGNDSGLVTQLDPDATTRQKAALKRDSSRDEDALNGYLFKLVKAGGISQAARTCVECGQSWRAASLLGGGPNGPTPLGPAAQQQKGVKALEQLAAEIEAGSNTAMRIVWKWACYQVAETAADSHQQSSEMAGKHEAALYATLAGHLAKILPVCQTRADFLWAHSRCWLEAQVDKQLAASQDQDDSGLHAALSAELDAVGNTRHAQPQEEVHSIVLDDVTAFWPPSRLTDALPDSFEGVLQAAHKAAEHQPDSGMEDWQMQQDIIQQDFAPLLARFVEAEDHQAAQDSAPQSATDDKQRAARLRMGAHLALALCYLPVEVPGPQDKLHIRSQEEVDEDADPDSQELNKSDDLPLQDSVNQLLQQYVMHLIQTEQHDLVPIYACHMRQDVRRITYASYFHSLTQRDMAECHAVYRSAWESFTRWPRGDINGETELDDIVEQVMGESFWAMGKGPNQWAPTLRWLAFSDSTLPLAAKEANRVLRLLSLGGNPAVMAGCSQAFQALKQSSDLHTALEDEAQLTTLVASRPDIRRDCIELFVWYQFYLLAGLYTAFYDMWDTSSLDDDTLLEELHSLGQQYINGVLTLCGNNALASIWGEQDTAFQQDGSSHEVKIWVAPAVTDDSQAEARQGDCYNTVADQQMADFVTTVQASAASCCVSGIDVRVQKADDNMEGGMALVTVHIDHAQCDMGREVQCLNAIIKGDVPLQVVRMTGPDLVLGALASMAAYPYVLLRAAELRQVLLEMTKDGEIGADLGVHPKGPAFRNSQASPKQENAGDWK
ncbi:hypothetical protein WJX82_007971 [Trebouxia sp. C0006]